MNPDVIIVGIVIVTALLLLVAGIAPKLRKYRLVLRKVEPKKKRSPKSKGKKHVWIKVM